MLFKHNYNVISTLVFCSIIAIAHVCATGNYEWTKNTISDLGSQLYSRKLIMQFGFVAFGTSMVIGVLINGFSLRTLPILIYGFCISLTGFFCTKPFFNSMQYSVFEAKMHSLFAQVAGISFTFSIIVHAMQTQQRTEKWMHFLFLFIVILSSAAFGYVKNYQGVFQRVLYLASFIWLIKYYKH